MHFIIYGPEGSGKGTQAKLLAEKLHLKVYTSGDLVREAALKDKGLIGKVCRKALNEGKYVADKSMFVLWRNKLKTEEAKKGIILDGFPRNFNQAEFLFKNIDQYGYTIDKVIYLELTDAEAIERLVKRHRKLFEGSNINHDDPERVKKRLTVYRKKEKKLLSFFKKKQLILEINALGTTDEVFVRIISALQVD